MTNKFALAALAASVLVAAPAAMAQDAADLPSATVVYADINLASDAGVTLLDRRIRAAARRVCGEPESNALFGGTARLCIREVIAAAQVNRDQAIAAARDENGTRMATTSFEVRRAG